MDAVLFGYGNPSRGDDALGPRLLDRAEAWLADHLDLDVTPVADFQLQIEHTLDLKGRSVALFLDADAGCPAPFAFRRAGPSQDASYSTHELSPGALLHVYRLVEGAEPPPAFILGIRGERFELGDPLSPQAQEHLEAAWAFLQSLLADPRPERWSSRLT